MEFIRMTNEDGKNAHLRISTINAIATYKKGGDGQFTLVYTPTASVPVVESVDDIFALMGESRTDFIRFDSGIDLAVRCSAITTIEDLGNEDYPLTRIDFIGGESCSEVVMYSPDYILDLMAYCEGE